MTYFSICIVFWRNNIPVSGRILLVNESFCTPQLLSYTWLLHTRFRLDEGQVLSHFLLIIYN